VFVAFAGGGGKGLIHVGALKALEDRKVQFCGLAGTSAGAIVASVKAAGFEASDLLDPETGSSLIDRLRNIDHGIVKATDIFGRSGWSRIDDQADSTAQFLDWYKTPFPGQNIFELYRMRAEQLRPRVRIRLPPAASRDCMLGTPEAVTGPLAGGDAHDPAVAVPGGSERGLFRRVRRERGAGAR
jgi:hypothetical protein